MTSPHDAFSEAVPFDMPRPSWAVMAPAYGSGPIRSIESHESRDPFTAFAEAARQAGRAVERAVEVVAQAAPPTTDLAPQHGWLGRFLRRLFR
jgi:hypothetical protein